jgi:hypothetical protein
VSRPNKAEIHISTFGVDQLASATQAGGNMEGKETRFGITNSALWATAASNGSVNAMHDSFTPLGGAVPLLLMKFGEVIYGGAGSGLYGMLVLALENGADDYLTKPFAAGELLARSKVALRHAQRLESGGSHTYDYDGLSIDLSARRVTLDGGNVHLTPIEYKLLSVLARNAGKVLPHASLLKAIWGRHSNGAEPLSPHPYPTSAREAG